MPSNFQARLFLLFLNMIFKNFLGHIFPYAQHGCSLYAESNLVGPLIERGKPLLPKRASDRHARAHTTWCFNANYFSQRSHLIQRRPSLPFADRDASIQRDLLMRIIKANYISQLSHLIPRHVLIIHIHVNMWTLNIASNIQILTQIGLVIALYQLTDPRWQMMMVKTPHSRLLIMMMVINLLLMMITIRC